MKLKTNIGGFFTTAIMAGLFCLAVVRHGNWDTTGDQWTIDEGVGFVFSSGLVWLAVFVPAHFLLSRFRLTTYLHYAAAGAAALSAAFFVVDGMTLIRRLQPDGYASILIAVLLLFGAAFGFLYRKRCSFDASDDAPNKLLEALPGHSAPQEVDISDGVTLEVGNPAHVELENAEYFAGPLQVKTSIGSILLASLAGGAIWSCVMLVIRTADRLADLGGSTTLASLNLDGSFYGVVMGSVLGTLLFPIPIYAGHMFARWRGSTSYGHYAAIGAILPIVVGLMMFVIMVVVAIQFVLPMAMAMVLYRHLAGLEPRSLPEDIEVSDRRTLIAANHPRRSYNRIVSS